MSATSVSVLVPTQSAADVRPALEALTAFLQTTGFEFDVRPVDDLRSAAHESKGDIVVVADADLPYPVSAIGDAVALVESGAAEVVLASTDDSSPAVLRWMLVPIL